MSFMGGNGQGEALKRRWQRRLLRHLNNLRIWRMAREVLRQAPAPRGDAVVMFKASSGIDDLSWNAGFHLITSWALRLHGVPVVFFACHHGMSHCILSTDRQNPQRPPRCATCIYQSHVLYTGAPVHWFHFSRESRLEAALRDLSLEELAAFEWEGMPLGALCLPGLRWILRRHHLNDDAPTRYLMREYILSAWNIAQAFGRFLDQVRPRAVIAFNGQFYPEAVVCYVARQRGIRTITHEVGLQPASAFFTEGEATAYPIHIPPDFELNEAQNARLDAYLEQRFQGQFTMAGIRFWPEMRRLDRSFLEKASRFRQIVPIFTNVIFDTSQPHANTLFPDMFAWLDFTLERIIRRHPETFFVIRAHPDESRPGKESQESVAEWVAERKVEELGNVLFVPPQEYFSSYELIQRSKFVMVYNSTIGLEASILGAAVLCAGKARFTQYPTVFFPKSVEEYLQLAEAFLQAEQLRAPQEHQRQARRFLYYQLFRASLPFDTYLRPGMPTTQAQLKPFPLSALSAEHSPTVRAILRGVLENGDFLLEE
ncbi:MAG: hypothetical protein J7555_01975 [Chloroflexi bacterium]|jgi:hypothetical protein|nr:hypothetical protein [Chloroflexota bacterium]